MSLKLYPWQDALEKSLLDLRGKLPNGLLVYGPRGAGIFDLVQAFAKSLLCTQPTVRLADAVTAVIWSMLERTPTFAMW